LKVRPPRAPILSEADSPRAEFGETRQVDLKPNGASIPVTRENRLEYITLVAHFRLTSQIRRQAHAFFDGLAEVVDPRWLRMFNQQELQVLLGGADAPVDVADLREHASYGGLYDDAQPTIALFWQVVDEFDQAERRKLLRFVTSCSRPPLLCVLPRRIHPVSADRIVAGSRSSRRTLPSATPARTRAGCQRRARV
jgi:ubiquitin-protein ligase E3 C